MNAPWRPPRRAAEGEARLRAQQEAYESVRAERSVASRGLVEAQARGCFGGALLHGGRGARAAARRCSQRRAPLPPAPQDEAGELRRRLALAAHQAGQLRAEVAAKDGSLQREKWELAKASGRGEREGGG